MRKDLENIDVGVIVGRFQIDELHESHKKLFDYVTGRHDRVICLLGTGHLKSTKRNPLDFNQRKVMIETSYPDIICLYANDMKSDDKWSKSIDKLIYENIMPGQVPALYGSRDSFIQYYSGRYGTFELESDSFISASEVRRGITRGVTSTKDFRAGAIWATANKFPTKYWAVDIAIMNEDRSKILLARKPNEDKWRFVGGFTDPCSATAEDDAMREAKEETNCDVTWPEYICTMKIDDWRYRGEVDVVSTIFYVADYVKGSPKAQDDIEEIKWFDVEELFLQEEHEGPYNRPYKNLHMLVDEHQTLMTKLLDKLVPISFTGFRTTK